MIGQRASDSTAGHLLGAGSVERKAMTAADKGSATGWRKIGRKKVRITSNRKENVARKPKTIEIASSWGKKRKGRERGRMEELLMVTKA